MAPCHLPYETLAKAGLTAFHTDHEDHETCVAQILISLSHAINMFVGFRLTTPAILVHLTSNNREFDWESGLPLVGPANEATILRSLREWYTTNMATLASSQKVKGEITAILDLLDIQMLTSHSSKDNQRSLLKEFADEVEKNPKLNAFIVAAQRNDSQTGHIFSLKRSQVNPSRWILLDSLCPQPMEINVSPYLKWLLEDPAVERIGVGAPVSQLFSNSVFLRVHRR